MSWQCLSPSGICILSTKRYYFGVGGGTAELVKEVDAYDDMKLEVVHESCDGASNVRDLLLIRRQNFKTWNYIYIFFETNYNQMREVDLVVHLNTSSMSVCKYNVIFRVRFVCVKPSLYALHLLFTFWVSLPIISKTAFCFHGAESAVESLPSWPWRYSRALSYYQW